MRPMKQHRNRICSAAWLAPLVLLLLSSACQSDRDSEPREEKADEQLVRAVEDTTSEYTPPVVDTTKIMQEERSEPQLPVQEEETEGGQLDDTIETLATNERPAHQLEGYVALSYRARTRGSRNDEDLYGYVSLDIKRPSKRDVSLHVYGRATLDLDGSGDSGRSPFFSLNDVNGDRFDGKLYEAYVDLEGPLAPGVLGVNKIRLGRQRIHAGLSFLVDGGRVDFEKWKSLANLEVSIFGGIPVYLYDTSRTGDWMAGIDVTMRPFAQTRIDLRYVHIQDNNDWIGSEKIDDYASLTWRQGVGDHARFSVIWNTVGLDTRDIRTRGSLDVPDWDLSIIVSWFYQDKVALEYTTVLDAFVGVIGTSFAYHQGDIQVTKLFGDNFSIDLGATVRQLANDANESSFNREFYRLWLTLSSHKWPTDELSIAITGEWWDGSDDQIFTAGTEIDWRPTKELRFTIGSFYSLYKYDLFLVDEREDVTTIFLRARWQVIKNLRLDGRYEYETGDEGNFHSFWAGFTWRF